MTWEMQWNRKRKRRRRSISEGFGESEVVSGVFFGYEESSRLLLVVCRSSVILSVLHTPFLHTLLHTLYFHWPSIPSFSHPSPTIPWLTTILSLSLLPLPFTLPSSLNSPFSLPLHFLSPSSHLKASSPQWIYRSSLAPLGKELHCRWRGGDVLKLIACVLNTCVCVCVRVLRKGWDYRRGNKDVILHQVSA